jgi:hypothetical protein
VSLSTVDSFTNGLFFGDMLISAAVADGSPHIGDSLEDMKQRLARLEAFMEAGGSGHHWDRRTTFISARLYATRGSWLAAMAQQSRQREYSRDAVASFEDGFKLLEGKRSVVLASKAAAPDW